MAAHPVDPIREQLFERNRISDEFFRHAADQMAEASCDMAERLMDGGRVLAFGRGTHANDAQHVATLFIHPSVVGKRALPALELGPAPLAALQSIVRPLDIAVGIDGPGAAPAIAEALAVARLHGALAVALAGADADYTIDTPTSDPFIHQELVESASDALWESVHVFVDHLPLQRHAIGPSEPWPLLGGEHLDCDEIKPDVARAIVARAHRVEQLRSEIADRQAPEIDEIARSMANRTRRGGKLIVFGSGCSAVDANDFAYDCLFPPIELRPVPALSLSSSIAAFSGIVDDVGREAVFLRQLIPHASPEDVAFAIATGGSSAALTLALEAARRRGLLTIGLLGGDGGEIRRRALVDCSILVPGRDALTVQEAQTSVYHVLRRAMDLAA